MINDRTSHLLQLFRGKHGLVQYPFNGYLYLYTANRAGNRFIRSNKIQNLIKKFGLEIKQLNGYYAVY